MVTSGDIRLKENIVIVVNVLAPGDWKADLGENLVGPRWSLTQNRSRQHQNFKARLVVQEFSRVSRGLYSAGQINLSQRGVKELEFLQQRARPHYSLSPPPFTRHTYDTHYDIWDEQLIVFNYQDLY